MSSFADTAVPVLGIAGLATAGVIARPFRLPEAVWALAGAAAVVALGLLPWRAAWIGLARGLDVYLFLAGMMLLAELARQQGLFDWLAACAVALARGSPHRLFLLVYAAGALVTVFLSNDATAVVLTPAVYAATRAGGAGPLPYLLACAFIANAASFVLPISNPANLVVYGAHVPHLSAWLAQFALPSAAAVLATYVALRLTQAGALAQDAVARRTVRPPLDLGGRLTGYGLLVAGITLIACSALDIALGWPTFLCGVATVAIATASNRQAPWGLLRRISWDVLLLTAGLFVLVQALQHAGIVASLGRYLAEASAGSPAQGTWAAGIVTALASNLMNNLPVGMIAGSVVLADHLSHRITGAMLIAVDLGPNLSVTGSLASILWLLALRREGVEMGAWRFFGVGIVVMTPALILSIAAVSLEHIAELGRREHGIVAGRPTGGMMMAGRVAGIEARPVPMQSQFRSIEPTPRRPMRSGRGRTASRTF